MSLNLEAADMLLAARDEVMKADGWKQGDFGAWTLPEGAVCGAGALARVTRSEIRHIGALDLAARAAIEIAGCSIACFNDEVAERAEDVADLFDRAAAHLKGMS